MALTSHSRQITTGLAALALSVAVASAEEPDGPRGDREPPMPKFPISLQEVSDRVQEHFNALDTDGNGAITLEELQADSPETRKRLHRVAHAVNLKRQERMEMRRDREFGAIDRDGDGQISQEEYKTQYQSLHKARMELLLSSLDSDEDGSITVEEFPGALQRLKSMDADGDGMVSEEEMKAVREDMKDRRKHPRRERISKPHR